MNYDTELLSRYEANELLCMPDGFLENLARQRKGPAYFRFSHKVVRYSKSELIAWRDSRLVTHENKAP